MSAVQSIPSLPLLRFHAPEAIFAWQNGKAISADRFLTEVITLAERLPAHPYILNLCADRYRFVVGFCAALLRGQVSLLPPNHTPDLINRLSRHYTGLYCLTDSSNEHPELQTIFYPDLSGIALHPAPMPQIPASQVAAIVFTSGSTGEPMPNEKTWGALSRSVTVEADRLGILGRTDLTLLGTVPAQHMYGAESTAIITLQCGVKLHADKPFYPADICAALNAISGARVLVTTPVHLRALINSDLPLPQIELMICATAPLSVELATQAEERFGAPLYEVYGFTEAGQVASRRTAETDVWRTFEGLTMRKIDGVTYVSGGHVVGELPLSDITELHGDTTFLLQGRTADLINIAGKRTSLSSLNHHLNAIAGVQDGAFFMPDETADEAARLAAFVVAPGIDSREILKVLRQSVDAVFLPRPLHKVEALPRNATGKLPRSSLTALLRQCSRERAK